MSSKLAVQYEHHLSFKKTDSIPLLPSGEVICYYQRSLTPYEVYCYRALCSLLNYDRFKWIRTA
jgi:hypothetical protein